MATDQVIVSAATIDPALLAALKSAAPEQLGDDLVLRLADGRVFYIDGFFAADETGDGQRPLPGALPLDRDVADLLLGADDIETAAGGDVPTVPDSSGAGFIQFDGGSVAGPPGLAGRTTPSTADAGDDDDRTRGISVPLKAARHIDLDTDDVARPANASTIFQRFGGGGLAPIGAISISAGSLASPSFAFALSLRDLVGIHQLDDPAYDGRFPGLIHLLPIGAAYDFSTLQSLFPPAADPTYGQGAFDYYKVLHQQFADYVADHNVWFGFADTNSMHRNEGPGSGSAQLFSGDDIIFGTSVVNFPNNIDVLSGYGGNDIIVAYNGLNYLDGGDGDDVLIVTQPVSAADIANGIYPSLQQIDGGDGFDTLVIQLMDGGYVVDPRQYAQQVTSIEALTISVYKDHLGIPPFLVTDTRGFALEGYPPVVILDAGVIADWGGTLTLNAIVGRVHLVDVDSWTRLPDDPAQPGYTLYTAQHNGQAVSLAIANAFEQPIADTLYGTAGDDQFVWSMRSVNVYDGGDGNDTISSKLTPYVTAPAHGAFDLVGSDTPIFRNIEIFQLNAGDHMSLSAGAVAAVTDARNTLWITSDFAINQSAAAGKLSMTDLAAWQSLGYASLITDDTGSEPIHRTGALFTASVGGETVTLFVSVGIELPLGLDVSHLNTWSIWYDGVVALPPPSFAVDLDLIDFGTGTFSKSFTFSVDEARGFAGVDGKISIVTDDVNDVVTFSDPAHWTLDGIVHGSNGGPDFYVYTGHDGAGSDVTLRVQTDIIEPVAILHPTNGDDTLRLTEVVPTNLDGGDGFDRLHILGKSEDFAGLIDLAQMDALGPSNIELIDLHNGASSKLQIDAEAVARLVGSDLLYIVGDHDDGSIDQVFFQDVAIWSRTGVVASPDPGGAACVRYEADATINGVATHLTVAIASDLLQPIG